MAKKYKDLGLLKGEQVKLKSGKNQIKIPQEVYDELTDALNKLPSIQNDYDKMISNNTEEKESNKDNEMYKKIEQNQNSYISCLHEYYMLGHEKTEEEMFKNEHNQDLLEDDFTYLRYIKKARPEEYLETVYHKFNDIDREIIEKHNLHIVHHVLTKKDVMEDKHVNEDIFDKLV